MSSLGQVALITGASSGFGREAARELARRGWRVFGTSRTPAADELDGFRLLALDVRRDESVRQCVEQCLPAAGRLDLLVNNAGYVLNGFAEECGIDQVHHIFETNFFGAVRLVQAVLPIMRQQGGGRIINVGSLAGRVGVPYRSFYSATKFALEGYSESLSYELRRFNIRVSLIEPGFFHTNLDQAAVPAARPLTPYDPIRHVAGRYFEQGVRRGGDPALVGRLIADVAEHPRPCLRYRLGRDAVWLLRVRPLLGDRLYGWAVRKRFKLS